MDDNLFLSLHRDKKILNITYSGIDFVGYVAKPNRFFLRQKTLDNIFKLVDTFIQRVFQVEENILNWLFFVFNSFLGMLRSVKGFCLRQRLCFDVAFPFFYFERDLCCIKSVC